MTKRHNVHKQYNYSGTWSEFTTRIITHQQRILRGNLLKVIIYLNLIPRRPWTMSYSSGKKKEIIVIQITASLNDPAWQHDNNSNKENKHEHWRWFFFLHLWNYTHTFPAIFISNCWRGLHSSIKWPLPTYGGGAMVYAFVYIRTVTSRVGDDVTYPLDRLTKTDRQREAEQWRGRG